MKPLGLLVLGLLALSSLVGAAVHNANDWDELYNLMSNGNWKGNVGNNIVDKGDIVIAAVGTFHVGSGAAGARIFL